MFLDPKQDRNRLAIQGLHGLPEHYPIPKVENMVFYIQRNQNISTVIYELNLDSENNINPSRPLNIYWKHYCKEREDKEINHIQRKLAYGINHAFINDNILKINIVSYTKYDIFISKNNEGMYIASSEINGKMAILSNVYVFAEEIGAFPIVRYVELYGTHIDDQMPCFQKITI